MNIVIFDPSPVRDNLLPLTYTRPVGDLRVGIFTIAEKWRACGLEGNYSWQTERYLAEKFPCTGHPGRQDTVTIWADVIATPELAKAVSQMRPGDAISDETGRLVAVRGTEARCREWHTKVHRIYYAYDLFMLNDIAITEDFALITAGRKSAPLPESCTLIGPADRLFIEEGADVEGAMFNTKGGPVYIGRNATVMEGATLRGPIAVCEHAQVNMGARIYGATTIGPWCKVGGELNNVVMLAYSNKAHDGFLGNAVVGQWCNIGAGCTASNLKNDYTPIKLWNYPARRFVATGLQFCGTIMGDHTKLGINSMLNTATTLGVGVNIHGTGFPRNFVASFSEGGAQGYTDVPLDKFFAIAERMMARRGIDLTEADRRMYTAIRDMAENYK